MSKVNIWWPMYAAEFTTQTTHLSAEDVGAYVRILNKYWYDLQAPPEDNRILARITGLSLKRWQKVRSVLSQFFDIDNGKWIHERMEAEIVKAQGLQKKRSESGKKGARVRYGKDSNCYSKPIAKALQNDRPIPSPLPIQNTTCIEERSGSLVTEDCEESESIDSLGGAA